MNRSEVILDLQKLKGVTAPIVDLHKLRELEGFWPRAARIALARITYSYPRISYHRRHRKASDIWAILNEQRLRSESAVLRVQTGHRRLPVP
jgi:hypothetical protein